jgi:hypothetical protein
MLDDGRCCGTGTCIINALGHCWCGQQWDGERMCRPELSKVVTLANEAARATNEENHAVRALAQ